jgi:DNA polymerase elongation subunit (family B)
MEGKTEFLLFDIDYILEAGIPVIRLWGKTRGGKTMLALDRHFKPYFYFEIDDKNASDFDIGAFSRKLAGIKETGKSFVSAELLEKKLLGEARKFVRVKVQRPGDVNEMKSAAERWPEVKKPYEYDIPFYRRYLIDKDITPMGWVSALGTEAGSGKNLEIIEAVNVHGTSGNGRKLGVMAMDIEIYGDEVIMVSLAGEGFRKVLTYGWSGEHEDHVEILAGEREMLERLAEVIVESDPDVIATYNGDLFDFVKIKERADFHKLPLGIGRDGKPLEFVKRGRAFSAFIPGRQHLDLYVFIEHILGSSLESETLTLDMVSRELLGTGKDALEWKDIERLWSEKKNLKAVADYCLKDSELTLQLSGRLLPQIFELSMLVGQTPFDTSRMTNSQLVEWLLIRNAHVKNEIVLSRPAHSEILKRREASPYAGGYVLLPEPGIHDGIALFDFASLYPSIIITHNISPETLDKNGEGRTDNSVPESDHYFSLEKKGFIPEIMEGLVEKRTEIKKEMDSSERNSSKYRDLYNRQYAIKTIANASYGYYAYAGSRWYSRICAMSIAAFGRYYIQKVISFAKERGLDVIYGDTDSLFIADCSEQEAKKLLHDINKTLPGIMELDFEGLYASGLFVLAKTGATAKKRYALLGKDGRVTIRGFEKVRRDWCKIAKDTQEKVLLAILKDRDEEKAIGIVREITGRINRGEVDTKELVIYTQLTKPLKSYEQIGPHVAAAMKYAARGQAVKAGSVIGYIITRGEGSISERAEPFEYAQSYDPDYYINNQILPAAMRILSGLGLSEDDVLGETEEDQSQSSLDTFMKKSLRKKLKKRFGRFKGE